MNILDLELKNFRSHRHTILDLSEISTAAVCGENGNGKSSLLYGLTFVFWGTVPDVVLQDIPTKGAKDCFVRTDVLTDQRDESGELERYRITRVIQMSYGKKTSASSKVTLGLVKPSGTIIDCSGNSVDETNKKIIGILGGLTYKMATFSNFALQGESDKFMQALPAARRALFESILNLDLYDRLKEKAKGYAKNAKNNLEILDVDDASEHQFVFELEQLGTRQAEISKKQKETNDTIDVLMHSINETEKAIGDGVVKIEQEIQKLATELSDTNTKITAEVGRKKLAQDIIKNKEEIESKRLLLLETRKILEDMSSAKNDYLALTGRKSILENEIKNAEAAIKSSENTIQILAQKKKAFENNVKNKFGIQDQDIDSALATQKAATIELVENLKIEIEDGLKKTTELRARNKALIQEEATCAADINNCTAQIKKITSAGPLCPVFSSQCERLQGENRDAQVKTIKATITSAEARRAEIVAQRATIEGEIKAQEENYTRKQASTAAAQKQLNEIDFFIQSFSETVNEIARGSNEASAQVDGKQKLIADSSADITEVNNAIQLLDFDPAKHQAEEIKYNELCQKDWEKQYQNLLVAEEAIRQIDDKIAMLESRKQDIVKENDEQTAILLKKRTDIAALEPQLTKQKNLLATKKAERDILTKEGNTVAIQIGTAESNLNVLRKKKNNAEIQRKRLKTYEALAQVYDTAKTLITDNAIPRFQDAANSILEYLGINVRIEVNTLEEVFDTKIKQNKTNKIFEIIVIDGEGDRRDYATWSGGEKHRINIALRQALSMTLLSRAGTKIPLIVIDEGDTKLDAGGKEALVQLIEAANTGEIGGYPAKVMFITHSEDLKDSFSQRIMVAKGKNGSTVKVF